MAGVGSSIPLAWWRLSSVRWAVGGWSLFIVENLVLSENRQRIIKEVGDDNYHYIYGTLSTAAMASTGYGFMYHVRNAPPFLYNKSSSIGGMPLPYKIGAMTCLGLGLGIASQTAPKLQIPIALSNDNTPTNADSMVGPNSNSGSSSKWKVRCPFDFTDSKSAVLDGTKEQLSTADRISRHPGLFSFGLTSLGLGLLSPSLPTVLFGAMPMWVAIIGGAHTDSRHERHMGGQPLSPIMAQQTSLLPFYALLANSTAHDWMQFWQNDVKGLNLAISLSLATLLVLRKGRGVRIPKSILKPQPM